MGRLRSFDYKSPYFYMVTLKRRKGLAAFSAIGQGMLIENALTRSFGKIIREFHLKWRALEEISPFVVMPDHIHLMVKIKNVAERQALGRYIYQLEKALAVAYWEVARADETARCKTLAAAGLGLTATGKTLAAANQTLAATGKTQTAAGLGLAATSKTLAAAGLGLAATGKTLAAAGLDLAATGKTQTAAGLGLAATSKTLAAANQTLAATSKTLAAAGLATAGCAMAGGEGSATGGFVRQSTTPLPVFEPDWHDWIVKKQGQLAAFRRYIRENPARAWTRQANAQFFQRIAAVEFLGRRWFAYGNPEILKLPTIMAFKGHRATSEGSEAWNKAIEAAERIGPGGAGISTFMSPLEKACGNAIAKAGGRLIVLSPEGFSSRWHPTRDKEKFCAAGKMLFLSLYEAAARQPTRKELYERCHEMVDLAVDALPGVEA